MNKIYQKDFFAAKKRDAELRPLSMTAKRKALSMTVKRKPLSVTGFKWGLGMTNNYKRGFTLIELLVVVLIIGLLSAFALPQYQKAVGRARVAKALPVLRALVQAKQRYYMANWEWTGNIEELDIQIPYKRKVESEG